MRVAINCKKSETIHITFMDELIAILKNKQIDFLINDDIEGFDTSNYSTFDYHTSLSDIDYF